MERINQSNTQFYNPAEVLISVREPYNKNTLWIRPYNDILEIKVFDKGWKTISTTEDKGLSNTSLEQINELLNNLQDIINNKIKKHLGRYSSDSQVFLKRQKELQSKIEELEENIKKLNKRQQSLAVRLKDGK